MASLNTTTKGRMKTTNKSGHAAYKLGNRDKLVSMALTTMLGEKKYYGDNTDELVKLAESMCESGDGEFVAKLAVWARTKGNLRSVSHVLAAIVARKCGGKPFIRPCACAISSMRGDDGTEIVASYLSLYGKPINHALLRGVRDALEHEKPYSIAKYQSHKRDVTLRDTLRLTHPAAAVEETAEAMGKCINGTLPFPKSWETELSARGNTAEVWNELLSEGKVPFMACLRNMRNIIKSGAGVEPVLDMLSSRVAVAKSRQLPFRFYSAYRELEREHLATTKVSRAIDMALTHACRNADVLPGKTAVLIDTSGSMSGAVSLRSTVSCRDVAAVLGAMFTHISDDAAIIGFDSSAYVIPMAGMSVLSDVRLVPHSGGWTNMAAGFDMLSKTGFDADRVIVLSDMECNGNWSGGSKAIQAKMDEYRHKVGHDVWCHAVDLQGYGTAQFIGPKTNFMAGWSDQILRFIALAEGGIDTLVGEIDGLTL